MPLCVHAEGQTLAAVMMLAQLCQRPIHVCHIATKTEVCSLILFNCTVCIVDDFLSSAMTVNYFGFTIGDELFFACCLQCYDAVGWVSGRVFRL